MAEDKKGFLLYADYEELFEELADDVAGRLIKHILKYVNDKDPISEDAFVKIAFIPIKKQLKRDLDKYEDKREQWSEAGKKSAESRRLKKEQALNSVLTESTTVKSVKIKSKTLKSVATDSTVNVNVNVNDNVIKEIKGSEIDISPFGSDFMIHWETWLAYKKSQFGFRYKLLSSEQTAFNDLVKKSNGEKLQAIAIINNSIANGWKGLIEMKNYYPQIEPLHSQTINRPIGTTKSMFE